MLRTRVLTGLSLAVIVVLTVFGLETSSASLVFGVFWLVGVDEWARLASLGPAARAVYGSVFVAMVITVITFGLPVALADGLLWLAAAVWLVTFWFVLRFPMPLSRIAIAAMGLVVIAAAWLSFHRVHGQPSDGPGLILAGLGIVWSADIGAFFAGRTFGRTPLASKVSPKKTWEGVAGGVVLATIAGLLAALALDRPFIAFGSIAAAVALISVVGDLGVSMLKRHAGDTKAFL